MRRIFITGISGYIASLFARTLLDSDQADQIETIVGIDIRPPDFSHPKLEFIVHDVREPITQLLKEKKINTIVHTAWVLAPDHDCRRMEDINLRGSLNILEAAKETGINQIIYTSSTTAYGFHPDNEIPLTEESPLRGNDDFTYAKNKKEIEVVFSTFTRENPGITTTVLRPCYVAGPGLDNPLSTFLKKPFVPLISKTAPFQYVHEDDLVRVMILCVEKRVGGIFNVAPEGSIEFDEMVRLLGNIPICLPETLVRIINGLAWKLRLRFITEFPNPALNLIRYPWIASSEKLINQTGFQFKYDTTGAFKAFASHYQASKGEKL